jgi:hypothetical protein
LKRSKTILFVAALASLTVGSVPRDAHARATWFILAYVPSYATGKTNDFIDVPGYYGFGVEGRSFESKRLSWAFETGWQNMYEKTAETFQHENVTISGTQVRYLDFIPILLGADYHFGSRKNRIRPFAGVKGGVYYVGQRVEIGTVEIIVNRNWHLGTAPELGITFLTWDMEFYGYISADYNIVFPREDSITYTYLSVTIGFVYIL